MKIEAIDKSFVNEINQSFSARDITDLAKRLGNRGHGNSWEEVLSTEERTLRFSGIGRTSLNRLDKFKEILAEKARISTGMSEHSIKYVIYGKSQYYRCGLYLVDGVPISFPSSYSNQNIIWLLKGDSRRVSIDFPEVKKNKMVDDIEKGIRFLNSHFDLGLEFKRIEDDGIDYVSINVPRKTRVD